MPSSNTKRDFKSWNDSLPKERADDHEFNLLLFRFKTLYNEICDYHNLHSDCSVTKNAIKLPLDNYQHHQYRHDNYQNNIETNNDRSHEFEQSTSSLSHKSNGGQSVINLRKKFFQQNDSGLPLVPNSPSKLKTTIGNQHPGSLRRQSNSSEHERDLIGPSRLSKHHCSIHNLTNSASVDIVGSHSGLIRPEIKQRNSQQANTKLLLLSKSSERLDSLNNNHLTLSTSDTSADASRDKPNTPLESLKPLDGISNISPILNRHVPDDDTIYDAVSPDDLGEMSDQMTSSLRSYNDRLPPVPQLPPQFHGNRSIDVSRTALDLNKSNNNQGTSSTNFKLPSKQNSALSKVQLPNSFNESKNALSSSMILGLSRNQNNSYNDSSLSLVPNSSFKDQEYANYVNIDFFLKRSQSPSFDDGLEGDSSDIDHEDQEEDDDDEDEDTTQMSHSISTDQICEDLKQLSPRDLARKLSIVNRDDHQSSSASITPASSGDFLDDTRSPTATIQNQLTSTASTFSRHFEGVGPRSFNNLISSQNQSTNGQNDMEFMQTSVSRGSTTPRDSNGSRVSLGNQNSHPRTLGMIHEDQYQNQVLHKTNTIPPRQVCSNRDSSQHLDKLVSQHGSFNDGRSSNALAEAHSSMRSFLSDLNLSPVDDVFEDKAQRRIVKESFAVEYCGRRKLRHLFLFNDVIVCAKYQASSKQKFTFDVKWYLNLIGVTVSDVNDANNQLKLDLQTIENQILAIRTNLMILRGKMQQIKRSRDKKPSKIIKKLKKKRTELEAELVLLLPHLPLIIKHVSGKKYLFFLSSNFDRNQWVESIKYLQSQLPSTKSSSSTPSSSELQAWIQTCRKNLNPSLGTFLLRSNCDDDLLYGDLYINLNTIRGIPRPGHYYFCFEVDSYGHFSQKASSVVLRIDETDGHDLNDEYIFPLDGAHTLRILLYEDQGQNMKPSVVGKTHVELSRAWCLDRPVEREIEFNPNCRLTVHLSYSNSEILSMRIPHSKLCSSFGLDIAQVCKKEKTQVPLLIQLCVNEVERRGMREVGIYRMSGTSTDIQRLKKAFDANPLAAELLLRDIDINSVTGFLKTYLREMPEGLFINKLYPKYVAAFNMPQSESHERKKKLIELFKKIPIANQHTIAFMVEHLVKVNKYESYNKMSLTNLATVLGPNILRPLSDSSNADSSDPFTAVVIGSMSQAGILYFFLDRAASNLSMSELDPSEAPRTSEA